MGEGGAPALQVVRLLAPALPLPLFHRLIGGKSAPASALTPPLQRMLTAKITLHKVYFQRTFLKHLRA